MWNNEADFQKHMIDLLKSTREKIIEEYKPFTFLNLSVDIKSTYQDSEEWRELKIINYKNKNRSIQNLWKGIGKVEIMSKLRLYFFPELSVSQILSLPQSDFESLHIEVQKCVNDLVKIEIVNQLDYMFVGEIG